MTSHASKLIFLAALVAVLASAASAARPSLTAMVAHRPRGEKLAARLKLAGGCWESLVELQACTGEVLIFFLDGETHLGPGCCRAIRVIGGQCWPAMFASLGFTAQEVDVLQGFCDASQPPRPLTLSPLPSPSPSVPHA